MLLLSTLLALGALPDTPPNVVVLLVDDLGWTDLGCYGSSFYETPNIDRLAAQGVRFTQAYAASCVCSPTRGSLLCGKTPARTHTTDYFGGQRKAALLPAAYERQLALEELTLAEALKEHGYRTAFLGKWHLGGEGFLPGDQGFDVNVGGWHAGHPYEGYFAPWGNPQLPDGPQGEYLTDRLTDEALAFLDGVGDDPFLLYFAYYTVHTPLQARADLQARFEAQRAALPERGDDERFGREEPRKVRLVQDHAVYAGMVAALDESVGRVLAKLDERGLADDTLVVLFSDNGGLSTSEGHPTSNLPLRAGKGWLYEGGIREPLIVRGPGVAGAGRVIDAPVISHDLMPTVLELCGLPPRPAQHLDGVSFAPALAGDAQPERELCWHYPHYGNQGGRPSGALRSGDWKLIEFFEDERVELYDLAHDLGEQRDLAAQEPERAAALRARLHAWRAEVGARMPAPNPEHGK
jgi:arylsulfatase A-like enzyme